MGVAFSPAPEPLDSTWLQAIMIRWKLGEQWLLESPAAPDTGKTALHVLLSTDFPVLLRELLEVRPDLRLPSSESPGD